MHRFHGEVQLAWNSILDDDSDTWEERLGDVCGTHTYTCCTMIVVRDAKTDMENA